MNVWTCPSTKMHATLSVTSQGLRIISLERQVRSTRLPRWCCSSRPRKNMVCSPRMRPHNCLVIGVWRNKWVDGHYHNHKCPLTWRKVAVSSTCVIGG